MKVKELIALLAQMPAEAEAIVSGYEDGVDDVVDIRLCQIRRDVHEEWYYGKHEIDDSGNVQAVLIAGPARTPD